MTQLEIELEQVREALDKCTNFIEKLELKDRELEIKMQLGLIESGDSYEACEGCSA